MFVTEILSLKGLFLCLRIATHLLMAKTAFCPDGSLLAQLANPTHFPSVLFPREKSSYHSSNIQRNGMEKIQAGKKNHSSKILSNTVLLPSLSPLGVISHIVSLGDGRYGP